MPDPLLDILGEPENKVSATAPKEVSLDDIFGKPELKKKEPLEDGSEVGGQSTIPVQDLPLAYEESKAGLFDKLAESIQTPQEKSGFRTVQEMGKAKLPSGVTMEKTKNKPIDFDAEDRRIEAEQKEQREVARLNVKDKYETIKPKLDEFKGIISQQKSDLDAQYNYTRQTLDELKRANQLDVNAPDVTELIQNYDRLGKETEEKNNQLKNIENAELFVKDLENIINGKNKKFSEGVYQSTVKKLAFDGIAEIKRNFDLKKISDKISNGEEITADEQLAIASYGLLNEAQSNFQSGIGYDVGRSLVEMVPYLFSFAVSGGVSKVIQAGISSALKATGEKTTKELVKKGIAYVSGQAVKPAFFSPLYSSGFEKQIGQVETTKDLLPSIAEGTKESPQKAFAKAYANTMAEVMTEQLGEVAVPIFNKIIGKEVKQALNPIIIDKIKDATAFNGFLPEMGEEFANEVLNTAIEGRPAEEIFDPRKILTTALTVGVMSSGFALSNTAYKAVINKKEQESGLKLDTKTKKQIDAIIESDKDTEEKAKELSYIVDEKIKSGANNDEISNIVQYATSHTAKMKLDEVEPEIQKGVEKKAKEEVKTESEVKVPSEEKTPVIEEKDIPLHEKVYKESMEQKSEEVIAKMPTYKGKKLSLATILPNGDISNVYVRGEGKQPHRTYMSPEDADAYEQGRMTVGFWNGEKFVEAPQKGKEFGEKVMDIASSKIQLPKIEEQIVEPKIRDINKLGREIALDKPNRKDYEEGKTGDEKYVADNIKYNERIDNIINEINQEGTLIDNEGYEYQVEINSKGMLVRDSTGSKLYSGGKRISKLAPFVNGFKFKPKITEEPTDASRILKDEGQVQERGNVRQEGQGEGGPNLEQQESEQPGDKKKGLTYSEMETQLDELNTSINKMKEENANEFKKDGTIKAKSKLFGSYRALNDMRSGLLEQMQGSYQEEFTKRAREESEKSRLETEQINKAFEERQQELKKNIPPEELKEIETDNEVQRIFDKISGNEVPTQEEINFVNENAYLPKGFEFGEKGLQKVKEKKPSQPEIEPEVAKKEATITEEKFESAVTKGLDKGIEWLDEIDKQLSQFGKETLGVNLPVAVAQTGIRAAKVALQAGKTVSEVIDAAIDAVRKSDWYKGLTSIDKMDAEKKVRGLFTKETKIEDVTKHKNERVSAIKKASVPEEKVEETKINKRTVQGEVQRGKDLVDKGEIVPANLVSEVNANPRALNSEEVAALVYYKTQLDNSFDEIYDNLEKAKEESNDNDIIEYKRQLDIVNIALNSYYEAALNTAYEQGLAFRMRQILMDSEFNLATQIRKYKQINNGIIPTEIKSKFEEYDRRLKELNGKIRKLEERKAKSDGDEVIEKIKSSSKRKGRKMGKDLIEEGFDELMQAIGGKTMAIGDKRPSAIAALSKIGLGLIDEGVATIENVVAKIEEYVKSKNKDFNIDEYKDDLVKEINELRGISYNEDGLIKIPHDLLRSYVEKGIDNINDLVSAIKNDFQLDITDRELRDAITNYGKTMDLNKEEIEVKLREMRRIGRLLSGLEDVQKEKKRPLRSGLQRDKLSDKERRMQKELKESMKDLPLTDEEISKAWRTSLDAVKSRLKNQISDLIHRIDTGERTPNKKGIVYDEEANQLKEQRDLLQSILEKLEGKKEISDEQKVRMAIANVERMMDSYEERVRNKDFSPFKRAIVPQTPELIDAKKKLADIKALYNQMKEDAGIVEAMRLQRIKTNLNKSIKEYERRLREKDFSTKKRDKPILDEEALRLEIERNKIKYLYETEMEKAILKNRPLHKKVWDTIIDVWNVPKSFLASLDFSAPLRQGAILSFSHPKFAIVALKEMFKHTISANKAQEWVDKVRASDNYVIMKRSGLYLAEPTAKLSAKEEQFMTNIAHKIPGWGKLVSATERAYVGYLNKLRVDVFLQGVEYLNSLGYDFQKNSDKYKAYADFINNATGRGGLGFAEPIAKELNGMFFSPRLVASRINLLNPVKYVKMPKEVRKMVLRDMGIFVGTGMTILAIAAAAGADVEDDPRSSDFGKIKIGNLRFDIWAGFQQPIRSFIQLITGQRKSISTGVVSKISKQEFPNKSRWSVLGNFARSKMSPTSGLIYNIVEGENMMGEEVTLKTIAESSLIPLYLNDVYEIYKEEGLALTIAGSTASLFGVGVQHYSDTDPVKKAIRDNLSLEETIKRITTNEDLNVFTTPLLVKPKELTDRQINEVKKRYRIYKKYGLDNPDINFLMSKGVKNEVKAKYLIGMKKEGKQLNISELREYNVISADLRVMYNKMSNSNTESEEIPMEEIPQ